MVIFLQYCQASHHACCRKGDLDFAAIRRPVPEPILETKGYPARYRLEIMVLFIIMLFHVRLVNVKCFCKATAIKMPAFQAEREDI